MPYLSDEQIAKAREMDLLTYLERFEPGSVKKSGPGEYRLVEHDSFVLSNGKWNWFSQGIGGKNALDYLTKVHGMVFYDAAMHMLSIEGQAPPPTQRKNDIIRQGPVQEGKPFTLPPRHTDDRQAVGYLVYRLINRELAEHCVNMGIIYESVRGQHHNCVFVGRDKSGEPRFAAQRGIGTDFKRDAPGSDKRFNFSLRTADQCKTLYVYEGAIDALSDLTFAHIKNNGALPEAHFLALGGVSPRALDQYLVDHREIGSVVLRLDRDEPGREAAAKMAGTLQAAGYAVKDAPPLRGKDCNEELKAWLTQRARQKQHEKPRPQQQGAR